MAMKGVKGYRKEGQLQVNGPTHRDEHKTKCWRVTSKKVAGKLGKSSCFFLVESLWLRRCERVTEANAH